MSVSLGGADPHALARWTNDKAHRGRHPGWRIPIHQIAPVCALLRATSEQVDAIMLARLSELGEGQGQEALAVLHWLRPWLETLSTRTALDDQQQEVLAAFDRSRRRLPGLAIVPTPLGRTDELEAGLAAWIQLVAQDHADEVKGESDHPCQAELAGSQGKREQLLKRMQRERRSGASSLHGPGVGKAIADQVRAAMNRAAR